MHAMYGAVEPKCGRACASEPELRRRWGCDAPAESPVLAITCSACDGRDLSCATCGGRGEENIFRCPQHFATADLADAFRAYRAWDEHHVLPVPGGLLAQSGQFLWFCDVVRSERGVIDRERARREEAAQRRG